MKPPRFPLVIFDWDGTLADSTAVIRRALQRAAGDLNYPIPTDAQASYIIGMALRPALQHAIPTLREEDLTPLTERYSHHFTSQESEIVLFDGVREMLAALKARGHWLAVATGKSRRGLNRAFDTLGLREFFIASRCADEGFSKPHPGMLYALFDQTGMTASDALMVGDTTHDLQLAENAGTAAVGVCYGAHPPHLLESHPSLALVNSVSALAAYLQANA